MTSETQFDSLFNKALKSGVDKGDFSQPKGESVHNLSRANANPTGPSGPVKIAKKEVKQAEKKAALPKVRQNWYHAWSLLTNASRRRRRLRLSPRSLRRLPPRRLRVPPKPPSPRLRPKRRLLQSPKPTLQLREHRNPRQPRLPPQHPLLPRPRLSSRRPNLVGSANRRFQLQPKKPQRRRLRAHPRSLHK